MAFNTKQMYAIREVSEITGVKPVTLRAWQRRYNLLAPRRTDKGHRLFSDQDVETIKEIQRWLAKGVSIGKIAPLLKTMADNMPESTQVSSELESCDGLREALAGLNRGRAEAIIAMTMKEYPLDIVERRFIEPIMESLECIKTPLKSIQKGLFQSLLLTKLSLVIESENKASTKGKMLCVSVDPTGSLFAWLWATSLAEQGHHITLLDGVDDLSGLINHEGLQHFKAVAIFSNKALTGQQLNVIHQLREAFSDKLIFSGMIPILHQVSLEQ